MGVYAADYTNDLGYFFAKARLEVYAIRDGVRQRTERTFDANYLPPVLAEALTTSPPLCNVVSGTRTLRHAQAWLNATDYLIFPCLWRGGTDQFMRFYAELQSNSQFQSVAHHGETINDWYTRIYAST